MIEVRRTDEFVSWLKKDVRDAAIRGRITRRIDRLAMGNPGDVRPVGDGVSELRMDFGPGYRVYFLKHGEVVILLLAGGDKNSQHADIQNALELARQFKEDPK